MTARGRAASREGHVDILDNHLIAVATDAFGRTAQAEVVVARDAIAPAVAITAPDTIARRRGATATVTASDPLGLGQVTLALNGALIGTSTTAPFTVGLVVPAAANAGDTLTVTAIAVDRAGNSATATHALPVLADDVVVGQVLSDGTGLPLAEATVTSLASPSINSGDIVLLANVVEQFQFGDVGYRAQHGTLTIKDSLVPVAFGYPGASGPQDTTLSPVRQFLAGTGTLMTPSEAAALIQLLIRPEYDE